MKTCTRCNRNLGDDSYGVDRSRPTGLRPACKACEKAGRNKVKQKAYYQANREVRNAYGKAYYANNKQKGKDHAKRSLKRAVEALDDTYIKQLLVKYTSLKRSNIPQELVDLKRLEMSIKRKVKELSDEEC